MGLRSEKELVALASDFLFSGEPLSIWCKENNQDISCFRITLARLRRRELIPRKEDLITDSEEWLHLAKQFLGSGETLIAWCKDRDLNPTHFRKKIFYYQRKGVISDPRIKRSRRINYNLKEVSHEY